MRLPPLFSRRDPYWDAYVNRPPADANNLVATHVRNAPEGAVYPVKSDVHTPEVMTQHIQELARFFGAGGAGVAKLSISDSNDYPFAIVCAVPAEYDPRTSPGIGGQEAALTGAYVTFNLAAAIREFGFRATRSGDHDVDRLAVFAGLGTLDAGGRLVTPEHRSKVYLADIIRTDLPLIAASQETYEWARPTS